MRLLGISGSLRNGSYNTRLLELCRDRVPAGSDFTIYHGGALPFYDQDLDKDEKPAAVVELLDLVRKTDALLFATPEYNYSVPATLKNTIDWASRPAFNSVLKGRPAAIISASMSAFGGLRAQMHLKQILGATLTPVYPAPEFLLPQAHEVLSADGGVRDAGLEKRLREFLLGFVAWADKQPAGA